MANVVIVGTQWGDEGKGKIVDLLTRYADYIVRFQGGSSADDNGGALDLTSGSSTQLPLRNRQQQRAHGSGCMAKILGRLPTKNLCYRRKRRLQRSSCRELGVTSKTTTSMGRMTHPNW